MTSISDRRQWIVSHFVRRAVLTAVILTMGQVAFGQNRTAGSIEGVVADSSGGSLPGVTVTASSPVLQVRQVTTVTDGEGRYRIVDLAPGTYEVRFELAGFQPFARQGLQLDAAFAARVNATLAVGSLAETIVVTGESPVVDATNTGGGRTIQTELLTTVLPGNKTLADLVSLTPGMTNTAGENAGSLGLQGRPRFSAYGLNSGNTNTTVMIDGFQVIANNPLPDVGATDQTDIKTFGSGADVREPGIVMNLVMKSGGNDFHGSLSQAFMKQPTGNVDDELRQRRLGVGPQQRYFTDGGGDIGGRILRDKLWFYTAARYRRAKQTQPGLVLSAGPDGRYLTGDEPPAYPTLSGRNMAGKLSYQFNSRYSLSTFISKDQTSNEAEIQIAPFGAAVDFAHTAFEATNPFDWKPYVRKGEFKGALTQRMFFDLNFGKSGYNILYDNQPEAAGKPTTYDRSNLMLTGANIPHISRFNFWIVSATLSYLPASFLGGRHEFKMGYYLGMRDNAGWRQLSSAGDYSLMYDAGVPQEIEIRNTPVTPTEWDNTYSVFLSDQWRLSDRVTLNLGLRWDGQHSYVPEQSRKAGVFFPAETFPGVEVLRQSHFAPRAGVAWDVDGSGRSVVKVTYGWFNPEAGLAGDFNRNRAFATRFRWRDLNGNNDYDPGESNLNPNGPDFVSTTSAANNILNPDLELTHVHEATATFEHELTPGTAIRALYLYRRFGDQSATINVLRPYSAFNIPISRQDPGPDGALGTADDGATVTIYDYDAAFRGSAFVGNQTVNRPKGRDDWSQSIEGGIAKRLSSRWSMAAAYTATQVYTWTVAIPTSPNDEYFPVSDLWRWSSKINGNVTLPYDISLGLIGELLSAPNGTRTYVFRAASPQGGTPLRQLTSVNLRMEKQGSQKEKPYALLNVRAGKKVTVAGHPLQISLDLLNIINSNAVKEASYVSGPTFRNVINIVPPRQIRLGIQYQF